MRSILAIALIGLFLVIGWLSWGSMTEQRLPNVVLVTLDTVRADHVGLYGYERATTPHLDRFARSATVFEEARASSPWTLPSHASMFTGLPPHLHGVHSFLVDSPQRNVIPLAQQKVTLAEVLTEHGYDTGAFIANVGYLSERYQLQQGFDRYDVRPQRAPGVTQNALEWIVRDAREPFLLFVNYMDAHRPYNVAPHLPNIDWSPPRNPELLQKLVEVGMRPQVATPPRLIESVKAQYDAGIAHADAGLGRLLAGLDVGDRLHNTVVVITSDHGEYFGEHDLVEHSKDIYEPVLRVPLVVKAPAQREPNRVEMPVDSSHIPWLILSHLPQYVRDLASERGLSMPRPGQSPVHVENYYTRSKDLLHPEWGDRFRRVRAAIYDSPLKLIYSSDNAHELYDLEQDPNEHENLFDSSPKRANQLLKRVPEDIVNAHPVTAPEAQADEPLTEDERDTLRALGYMQ